MRDHGGNLDAARALYGDGAWIDLSTGINRVPYPVGNLSAEAWTALPTRSAQAALCAAARQCYRLSEEAQIAPLAGAQAGIQLLPLLAKSGLARVLGPTYNEHAAALKLAGWTVETVSNLAEVEGADLGVVVNPNNPSGAFYAPEALLDLHGRVGRLLVDESFADPRPELSLAPYLGRNGLLVLRSFGKFYGLAGVRLGFVLGAEVEIAQVAAFAGPWPVTGAAIEVGCRAMGDGDWAQESIARLRDDAQRMDVLAAKAGWDLVGGTELFRLYSSQNAAKAQDILACDHIWSRIFPWSENLIRLGLPAPEEWARVEASLARQG